MATSGETLVSKTNYLPMAKPKAAFELSVSVSNRAMFIQLAINVKMGELSLSRLKKHFCDSPSLSPWRPCERHKTISLGDGKSDPSLPRSAEQIWTSLDLTGGDAYHHTITDWLVGKNPLIKWLSYCAYHYNIIIWFIFLRGILWATNARLILLLLTYRYRSNLIG